MNKNRVKRIVSSIRVLLVLCIIGGFVLITHVVLHSRIKPDQNLRPVFQSDATWYSDDNRLIFQTGDGPGIGIFDDGVHPFNVKISVDVSGYYVYVYLPAFTEDGTSVHDPSLDLEEWTFQSKGEDWFSVEVVKSTYYEEGSIITFYLQKDTDK